MPVELTPVAIYRRPVHASIERVWENVHDWEHLPWLHAGSFSSIELEEQGDWGWRARIGIGDGREIRLELVIEQGEPRYVSRTLEGPGAGTEIWTTLLPRGEDRTDIEVAFLVPDVAPDRTDAVGKAFTELYTRLWDEDEAMMRRRTAELARSRPAPATGSLDLGDEIALRADPPGVVEFGGRRVRVVHADGGWIAHSAVCPHWLGPLGDAPVVDGEITCPWHGYRFEAASGRRCDRASPMRLAPAPRVVVQGGRLRLEAVDGGL